jgi:type III secretion protein J
MSLNTRTLAAIVLALLLTGCGRVTLYGQLSEPDANDALYTLLQGGVDAQKRLEPGSGATGGAPRFSLMVKPSDQARALGLLQSAAQPRTRHATLGELFARGSLISTPGEERIRFVYGIEQALSQTLSHIDGVLVARVHIVLPQNDPLAKEVRPSSASVFIKHRAGAEAATQMATQVPAIQELVVRSVEGLDVSRVAVTLFAAREPAATPR